MNVLSQNSKGIEEKKKSGSKNAPKDARALERERFKHDLLLKLSILKKAQA